MIPLDSVALQAFLDAELAAGLAVREDAAEPNWGQMRRLVLLDRPFRTRAWEGNTGLVFREVNDPHYWKAEVEDPGTRELVACAFD